MKNLAEDQLVSFLVKMADDFDRDGSHKIAAEIDHTIKSFSSRPRAPMKQLDDDVKKNLIIFIHDADENNGKSIQGLNELFRRLRYFDFADTVKDLGLEKVVKTLEGTRGGLTEAKKKFYELMHGKKPSKADLDELFSSITKEDKEQNALDFFDTQSQYNPYSDDDAEDEEPEEVGAEREHEDHDAEPDDEDDIDKEIKDEEDIEAEIAAFLADMEDIEDEGDE